MSHTKYTLFCLDLDHIGHVHYKYHPDKGGDPKKFQKIETFIAKDQTHICIKVNEKIKTEKDQKEKSSREKISSNFKSLVMKVENESTQYVQIIDANKCEHRSENFMGKMEGKQDMNIKTHVKKVNQFITKFSEPRSPIKSLRLLLQFIRDDIETGEPTHELYKAFDDYKNLLKENILKNDKELIESNIDKEQEHELEEILNRIEDHIMLKIYKYVFPIKPSNLLKKLDGDFYYKTVLYEWITPKQLDVKIDIQPTDIENAKKSVKEMEETATTISDKLNCVKNVYINLNKAYQFKTGIKEELSSDDQLPLLIYIIIQSHPKRFISNINYMNCFFNSKRQDKVFLQSIINVRIKINSITAESLKIKEDEFNKNVSEARENFRKKQEEEKKKN